MGSIDWQLGLAMWIAFLCIFIWLSRNDEDGIYRTLKDTHQSNLDDIERQELEEQEERLNEKTNPTFNSILLLSSLKI